MAWQWRDRIAYYAPEQTYYGIYVAESRSQMGGLLIRIDGENVNRRIDRGDTKLQRDTGFQFRKDMEYDLAPID